VGECRRQAIFQAARNSPIELRDLEGWRDPNDSQVNLCVHGRGEGFRVRADWYQLLIDLVLGVSRDMVQLWRQRWRSTASKAISIDDRLRDAERPGAPAEFTMEEVLKL
jgi:hypothetical protein